MRFFLFAFSMKLGIFSMKYTMILQEFSNKEKKNIFAAYTIKTELKYQNEKEIQKKRKRKTQQENIFSQFVCKTR